MFVVDTNILVYAADFDSPFNARCRALVEDMRRRSGAWFLTWGIGYEFLRVVTHRRALNAPWTSSDALRFLNALVESPAVSMLVPTERHPAVLAEILGFVPHITGSFWHDATTAVLMREHGVSRICTRDTGFHRFPFLEPIDPCA